MSYFLLKDLRTIQPKVKWEVIGVAISRSPENLVRKYSKMEDIYCDMSSFLLMVFTILHREDTELVHWIEYQLKVGGTEKPQEIREELLRRYYLRERSFGRPQK